MEPLYKTWAEIDLGAVRHNIGLIRGALGPETGTLAVVKADGYGHGMSRIARAALQAGVNWLGVSNIHEAVKLRHTFPKTRILILSAGMAGHARAIVRHRVTPVICSFEICEAVARAAERAGRTVPIHIVVDTGMGRIGLWHERALGFIKWAARRRGVRIEGLCSHFACAGDGDRPFTELQLHRFTRLLEACGKAGVRIPIRHIANSGAVLTVPSSALDLVRLGIMLYGVYPSAGVPHRLPLVPALTLKTRVCYLKRVPRYRTVSYCRSWVAPRSTRVATIPIGYGDGFNRALSNRGEVLVRGRRAPVAGNVTMDQTMIDVGDIPGVQVGDEVTVIGRQGGETITVNEVAELIGTIPYDVLCAMGKQVQHRRYLNQTL